MTTNLDRDIAVTSSKMYPIDLAPQKITIVKTMASSEVKMAHLLSGQAKTTGSPQIITHTGPLSLMRPSSQIISQGVATQNPQLVNQGSQFSVQNSQALGQVSQVITQPNQVMNQPTQIISQGSQMMAQGSQVIGQPSQIISQNSQLLSQPLHNQQVINHSQVIGQHSHIISQQSHNIGQSQVLSQQSQIMGSSSSSQSIGQQAQVINQQPQLLNQQSQVITQQGQVISHQPQVLTQSIHATGHQAQIIGSSHVTNQPTHTIVQSVQGGVPQPQVIGQTSQVITQSNIGQGTHVINQNPQGLSQSSQGLVSGGQVINTTTQIISQGSQLSVPGQVGLGQTLNLSQAMSNSGQVLSVGGQLMASSGQIVGASGGMVVTSTVRTLPPSVRVLPPQSHNRPVLSTVNVSTGSGVVVNKVTTVGSLSSHVPRGPAAGASLAVPRATARPLTLPVQAHPPNSSLGNAGATGAGWQNAGASAGGRGPRAGSVVYGRARAPGPAHTLRPLQPLNHHTPHTQPQSNINSSGVLTLGPRPPVARAAPSQAARPVPLLQRNYQATKVVGVTAVGVRGASPGTLFYEMQRPATPYTLPMQPVSAPVAASQPLPEGRLTPMAASASVLARPSILRKRDLDSSPSKVGNSTAVEAMRARSASPQWDKDGGGGGDDPSAGSGGSTTVSATSSPAPEDDPPSPASPPRAPTPPSPRSPVHDLSPRKKPRKQMLSTEVRECDMAAEEPPGSPPPPLHPPPRRAMLGAGWGWGGGGGCGWRATAMHFTRPSEVRRREPRPPDITAIAARKHALSLADGWKVHHLTALMDNMVSLESGVCDQLSEILRTIEANSKTHSLLGTSFNTIVELVKGNMQRSKIICEGIEEARGDVLRIFTHKTHVAEILTRQADKRCFRKHRSQS